VSLIRYLPGDGAFWRAVFKDEPELLEPPKPKPKRPASAGEIAQLFKLRG
jgi:hypothetical protein